ncbi:hypothetical protein U9M48_033832 [Paspalum notatum var. saurae]|uniref:Imidazoleglycerol-phosphate dehydratase n=1 Tax=Paspalum notatum var. saurae TaxID=547442 RepID=A0AAQ3X711_PASNO
MHARPHIRLAVLALPLAVPPPAAEFPIFPQEKISPHLSSNVEIRTDNHNHWILSPVSLSPPPVATPPPLSPPPPASPAPPPACPAARLRASAALPLRATAAGVGAAHAATGGRRRARAAAGAPSPSGVAAVGRWPARSPAGGAQSPMTTARLLSTSSACLSSTPTSQVPISSGRVRTRFPAFAAGPSSFSLRLRSSPAMAAAAGVGGNGHPAVHGESTGFSRFGEVKRVTKETNVHVKINLDGTGVADCSTGIPFLDHMLDQLASHGLFDVYVKATGDTHIDDHHSNEDIALAIGTALLQALGDRKGINRFGHFTAPLDEAAVEDLSGRPHLSCGLDIPTQRVGTFDTQLVEHFFQSLVNTSGMTLHIRQLAGKNSHHIIEACFKAFARALRQATEYDLRRQGTVPSYESSGD